MTKKENTIAKIIEYFNDNEEMFNSCIDYLDRYNGCLGDDRYYYMEELNEIFSGMEPLDLIYRAFHGCDDDTCTTDAYGEETEE